MKTKRQSYRIRKERTFNTLKLRNESGRPRLAAVVSNKYIYAQVIDDAAGKTLASASSLAKGGKTTKSLDAAKAVGELVAKNAIKAGVKKVVFDRGGRRFHGRVKALADAARAAGLEF